LYQRRNGPPINPIVLLIILTLVFGSIIGSAVYFFTAVPVTLIIEEVSQQVRTRQQTVEGMLTELGVLVDPEDVVAPSLDAPIRANMEVTIDKAEPIALLVDGQTKRFRTHLVQPLDILAEAKVTLDPHDRVLVDGSPISDEPLTSAPRMLEVIRAITITLDDAGERRELRTTARSVGAVLHEAGVTLYLADEVTPPLESVLRDKETISIKRSVPIVVTLDGHKIETRTHSASVIEALAQIGVVPIGFDKVLPAEDAPIQAGMTIRIVRVTETDEIEHQPVPYDRDIRLDASLKPGEQVIVKQGQNGIVEVRIHVQREDGLVVSRSTPTIVVIQTPQAEIIAQGPTLSPTIEPTIAP
jgi:uncharacterized protein YabE (DUF348 family)